MFFSGSTGLSFLFLCWNNPWDQGPISSFCDFFSWMYASFTVWHFLFLCCDIWLWDGRFIHFSNSCFILWWPKLTAVLGATLEFQFWPYFDIFTQNFQLWNCIIILKLRGWHWRWSISDCWQLKVKHKWLLTVVNTISDTVDEDWVRMGKLRPSDTVGKTESAFPPCWYSIFVPSTISLDWNWLILSSTCSQVPFSVNFIWKSFSHIKESVVVNRLLMDENSGSFTLSSTWCDIVLLQWGLFILWNHYNSHIILPGVKKLLKYWEHFPECMHTNLACNASYLLCHLQCVFVLLILWQCRFQRFFGIFDVEKRNSLSWGKCVADNGIFSLCTSDWMGSESSYT